ncbi:MAG: hypothetical protein II709_09935, partial [Ruminococcus sp.]|nr:hypothetical protein [Ruminococcus sp.]
AQPIENFIPIYEKAAKNCLALKAHVGEWGTAQDIVTAVKTLHLNEVQHGIAAMQDEDVIGFLAENDNAFLAAPKTACRARSRRSYPPTAAGFSRSCIER